MNQHRCDNRLGTWQQTVITWAGVLAWFVIVALPLLWLYATLRLKDLPTEQLWPGRYVFLLGRSCLLGALAATVSVIVGIPAGRLIGAKVWARRWGPPLLTIPLLIPPQVLYYAWGLVLLPNSTLGMLLGRSDTSLQLVGLVRSVIVLGCWYWPVCSLLLGVGWRRTDPDLWAAATIEAHTFRRWLYVGLPVMGNAIACAWLVTFALVVSQFSVFHLAAVDTLGTELATLYQLTGSSHAVAWAALPLVLIALLLGAVMERFVQPVGQNYDLHRDERCWRGCLPLGLLFWLTSTVIPVALLVYHVQNWQVFVRFGQLSRDGLLYSTGIAAGAALLAILIAIGVLMAGQCGWGRIARVMRFSTFAAALLPGSLIASAMVLVFNRGLLSDYVYNRPWIVSFGHAGRLAILAVLVIWYVQASLPKQLGDLARLDGAKGVSAAYHVWLPGLWPAIIAAGVLAMALSMTELSATMVLLPAGVPNFAQQLLNQMHYARDQQVIASCLVLIAFGVAAVGIIFASIGLAAGRAVRNGVIAAILVITPGIFLSGCNRSDPAEAPTVLRHFGQTGRGQVQFIYPRAITVAPDDTLFIVDKTARVQHLSGQGQYLGGWTMPKFATGKPVGISCGPSGRVYVADTHYHRVMIYSTDGKLLGQFGSYGTGPGQFIYPTDLAVGPDGRLFVSEYGGNDRISIFSAEGEFIRAFGSLGPNENQFDRPSGLCIDRKGKVLYVADACNHRIVKYDLDGKLLGTIGSVGRSVGQLRYPYDVNLLDDGTLLVCEYGNNRVQRFSGRGKSLGVWGTPGRQVGQLCYPWGAAADSLGQVFSLDSGNDRVQVWKF